MKIFSPLKFAARAALGLSFCLALIAMSAAPARATESAFGRYIPGLFAGPVSEIVPPMPGFYWQNSTFYYTASAGKDFRGPFGGELHSGLDIGFVNVSATLIYVPDWNPFSENINVAIGLLLPYQSLRVRSDVRRAHNALGHGLTKTDHSDGLGDIALAPAIGWHSGPHLWAAGLTVYMPTGRYHVGDMANIGLNCWTFTPNLAYAYVNPLEHVDFSMAAGVDINTRNRDSDYRSGAMAHIDATLLGTLDNGLGFGLFGSALYQISDDQGPLADVLGGFRGRSFSIGPMVKYTGPGRHGATININWAPEFHVKNRLKGDAFYLNCTGRF